MFNGTKESAAQTRKELNEALAKISSITGMDFSLGNIKYDANTITCKLTGVKRGATGSATPVDVKTLQFNTTGKTILGEKFVETKAYVSDTLGNVKFVGYNARAHAYPFIVVTAAGKRYKISTVAALRMVNR